MTPPVRTHLFLTHLSPTTPTLESCGPDIIHWSLRKGPSLSPSPHLLSRTVAPKSSEVEGRETFKEAFFLNIDFVVVPGSYGSLGQDSLLKGKLLRALIGMFEIQTQLCTVYRRYQELQGLG